MGVRVVGAWSWAAASLALALAGVGLAGSEAAADTLEWALVQAYQNNPSLNAQRAALRATDENVPQALSGYRPKLSVTAQGGYNYTNATQLFPVGGVATTIPFAEQFLSRSVAATGTYTLFNGFQTANRTRQAESQVARVASRGRCAGCRDELPECDNHYSGTNLTRSLRQTLYCPRVD